MTNEIPRKDRNYPKSRQQSKAEEKENERKNRTIIDTKGHPRQFDPDSEDDEAQAG
jgi:hypothetical protein